MNVINAALLQVVTVMAATMAIDTLYRVFTKRILNKINVTGKNQVWYKSSILALKTPLSLMLYIAALSVCVKSTSHLIESEAINSFPKFRTISILLIVLMFGLRFVFEMKKGISDVAKQNNAKLDKEDPDFSKKYIDISVAETGSRIASVVIISIFTLVFLHELGVSLEALVAFGGAGGLAVGFAAKDFMANFLGGLMINIDKPFTVGEWINSPDQDIEGTVEEIGWRMTTIRRFNRQPLYVMNAQFATMNIQNPGRMTHRRIWERIVIKHDNIEQIKQIIHKIRLLCENHSGIDNEQSTLITLDHYLERGSEIFIYCFTRTTKWKDYHQIKQDILIKASEIILEEGAEIAVPVANLSLKGTAKQQEVCLSEISEPSSSILN